jgi:uncharacterized phage-like protein YoqJ
MDISEKGCCFTGYRPEKFGFPLIDSDPNYRILMERLTAAVNDRIASGCKVFYTGMARGFDIIAAEYVELIARFNKDIKLIAVVPFKGQENSWEIEWQERYNRLLNSCYSVVTLSDTYKRGVYHNRNRYMVDRSCSVIAYFDGKAGGTGSTVEYAEKKGLGVINIFRKDLYSEETNNYKAYLEIYSPDEEEY